MKHENHDQAEFTHNPDSALNSQPTSCPPKKKLSLREQWVPYRMTGILAFVACEIVNAILIANRYGFYIRGLRGAFNGVRADVQVACTRILDRLRLEWEGAEPAWLLQIVSFDCLSIEQLRKSYPAGHPIWNLDISMFVSLRTNKNATFPWLSAINQCLRKNFGLTHYDAIENGTLNPTIKTIHATVQRDTAVTFVHIFSELVSESIPVPTEKQAFPPAPTAKSPRVSKATLKKWERHRPARLIFKGYTETCAKGSSNV